MRPAAGRPEAPGEPAAHLDLTAVNACVDIDPDGTTRMLLWDGTTAIVLHCGEGGEHTAALSGAHILSRAANCLELELRTQVEAAEQ